MRPLMLTLLALAGCSTNACASLVYQLVEPTGFFAEVGVPFSGNASVSGSITTDGSFGSFGSFDTRDPGSPITDFFVRVTTPGADGVSSIDITPTAPDGRITFCPFGGDYASEFVVTPTEIYLSRVVGGPIFADPILGNFIASQASLSVQAKESGDTREGEIEIHYRTPVVTNNGVEGRGYLSLIDHDDVFLPNGRYEAASVDAGLFTAERTLIATRAIPEAGTLLMVSALFVVRFASRRRTTS